MLYYNNCKEVIIIGGNKMCYDIFINGEFEKTIYSLAKLVTYLNDNNLVITRESEQTERNTVFVMCKTKVD